MDLLPIAPASCSLDHVRVGDRVSAVTIEELAAVDALGLED
jgi:hypothetical protein